MIAALALGGVGIALACALCLARLALADRERDNANAVVDAVDALLPQSQCAQCGYPGCRPYAVAVVGGARTDLCTPGGAETAAKISELLGRSQDDADALPVPIDRVARIDAADCVGCALCVAACPVDAIAGAPQFLHAIVREHCTGCELCVPACPVDCIELVGETPKPVAGARPTSFPPLPSDAAAAAIIARIDAAGIVGMGGGGYPTANKIRAAIGAGADCVIGNGMASEPGATADRTLLRTRGREVTAGLALVGRALAGCRQDAKARAPVRLVLAVPPNSGVDAPLAMEFDLPFPTGPAGDERRLVAHVVGRAVPRDRYPTDVGVLVLNVATLFAVYEAVALGRAPAKRLVTVGGDDAWHAVGAPLADLLLAAERGWRVNGPLTGYDAAPGERVKATTFAVDAPRPPALACIGCGWCVAACPEGLAADRLHRAFAAECAGEGTARRGGHREDAAADLAACIECGACTAVCPSGIDLVGEFREWKGQLRRRQRARSRAVAARQRWSAREQRLAQEADAARTRRAERMRAARDW